MDTWEARADEARNLAPRADEPDIALRLLPLLLDAEDTAVSQAAADALLARSDRVGVALFAEAFGRAEEDTRNKLSDCLWDDDGRVWSLVSATLPTLGVEAKALAEWMSSQESRGSV